jgi:hypothetical protein
VHSCSKAFYFFCPQSADTRCELLKVVTRMKPQDHVPSSTFHGPFKQQKCTACKPARGRHQLHFLPNERTGDPQPTNLDRCNRRRNSRSMRWRALKIYLITTEEGFTRVQFVNRLTIGRNRGASLGPTSSGSGRGLLGGRGWPAQCYLTPPPGGH